LKRHDPRRFAALLALAEEIVRLHELTPDLEAEIRRRISTRQA
jgi:hypothetical protein